MKKTKIAAVVLMVGPTFAFSQTVTMYGVVDTGVEFVNHIGPASNSVVRIPGLTGTVPSRWGVRGSEDLGQGLKAVFVLESGFSPDSGVSNQGGRLFGRQAFVGLSGNWGQLSLGRQNTMTFWANLEADMLGPNTFGSGSLDNYMANARADNAIAYKGTFGGLTVGGTYSFGRDSVNAGPSPVGTNCAGENPADARACREWSVLLQYDAQRWVVNAAYDSLRGGPGAFGGLTNSGLHDDRLSLNGFVRLGESKVGLGWIRRDNRGSTTPRSDLFYGGASYAVTPAFSVDAEVFNLRFHNSSNKAWLFAARGTYAFSRRSSVYATFGYIDNGGNAAFSVSSGQTGSNPVPGANQFGAMMGVKHVF